MKADVYNIEGTKVRSVDVPEELFGVEWNSDLVHQVVVSMDHNARNPIASTKGTSEVSGGGKKPWRQKGTGRARHGTRRSPLWVGGGVTHGPTSDRVFKKKINKKMRKKAFACVLSQKLRDNEILLVDPIDFDTPKTKDAKNALGKWSELKGFEKLSTKKKNAAILSLSSGNDSAKTSFRNIDSISVKDARSLSPSHLLSATYVIIEDPDTTFPLLQERLK